MKLTTGFFCHTIETGRILYSRFQDMFQEVLQIRFESELIKIASVIDKISDRDLSRGLLGMMKKRTEEERTHRFVREIRERP